MLRGLHATFDYMCRPHSDAGLILGAKDAGGKTWSKGTTLDSSIWANGHALEVAPDVVLYAYIDSFSGPMRTQCMRVTPEGDLVPVDMWKTIGANSTNANNGWESRSSLR